MSTHLSLNRAAEAALNIVHHKRKLRLKIKSGRHFILDETDNDARGKVVAVGLDWKSCLTSLLQTSVVDFIEQKNVNVSEDASFDEIAEMYLKNPDDLVTKYGIRDNPEQATKEILDDMLENPPKPSDFESKEVSPLVEDLTK
jgi:hypothetical protein